jgi:hypothetical protein
VFRKPPCSSWNSFAQPWSRGVVSNAWAQNHRAHVFRRNNNFLPLRSVNSGTIQIINIRRKVYCHFMPYNATAHTAYFSVAALEVFGERLGLVDWGILDFKCDFYLNATQNLCEQFTFIARNEGQYSNRNCQHFKARAASCVDNIFRVCEVCLEAAGRTYKKFLWNNESWTAREK